MDDLNDGFQTTGFIAKEIKHAWKYQRLGNLSQTENITPLDGAHQSDQWIVTQLGGATEHKIQSYLDYWG